MPSYITRIKLAIGLAGVLDDKSPLQPWDTAATKIKNTANTLLWDPAADLYKDNEKSTLHPREGTTWYIILRVSPATSQS
ncbi:hypothetical protein BJ878DRAFT_504109, partial [Calycina marina]